TFHLFFFFQAEDGIRDFHVTGVQTCALPILQQQDRRGYREAAKRLNESDVDLLMVEHEYGIFGGKEGSYLLDLVDRVKLPIVTRSEEHTSELQSRENLVCRLLLEKKNT